MVNGARKGKASERIVCRMLADDFGGSFTRNLDATREGGHDVITDSLEGVSIEIKDHKTLSLKTWWTQAVKQGQEAGAVPVLIYKVYRKGWRFRVPLHAIAGTPQNYDLDHTADLDRAGFKAIALQNWWTNPEALNDAA